MSLSIKIDTFQSNNYMSLVQESEAKTEREEASVEIGGIYEKNSPSETIVWPVIIRTLPPLEMARTG